MVTQELIERFFRGECPSEEQELVLDFFKANPEEFEKYFDENEWENFEAKEKMDPVLSRKLYDKVKSKTLKRKSVIRPIFRTAVAASIVLMIVLGWLLLKKQSGDFANGPKQVANVHPKLMQRTNITDKVIALKLEDGSTIELEPASTVKYYQPLVVNGRRNIQLIGQASFKVAKDKTKPFTVYADGIATTALGTVFTVKAFDTSNVISVTLYEGKVVVKSSDSVITKFKNDFLLLPGDEFVYTKSTSVAIVQHSSVNKDNGMVAAATDKELNRIVNRPEWYQFKSASLSEVFNQLSTYYQVPIYYYPDEVLNRYYSGKIEKTDSLENILRDIALLNQFTIIKKKGTYFIQKKNH